jgi:hypothetical protein
MRATTSSMVAFLPSSGRSIGPSIGLAIGLAIGLTPGCATNGFGAAIDQPVLALDAAERGEAGIERLPTPETAQEAQFYMKGAIAALRAGAPDHSALFLQAILRSDHLTDRGRANVYWLLAEASRLGEQDKQLVDALGGFLIAASVVPEDADIQLRTEEARMSLSAARERLALASH